MCDKRCDYNAAHATKVVITLKNSVAAVKKVLEYDDAHSVCVFQEVVSELLSSVTLQARRYESTEAPREQ